MKDEFKQKYLCSYESNPLFESYLGEWLKYHRLYELHDRGLGERPTRPTLHEIEDRDIFNKAKLEAVRLIEREFPPLPGERR